MQLTSKLIIYVVILVGWRIYFLNDLKMPPDKGDTIKPFLVTKMKTKIRNINYIIFSIIILQNK